jgi:hypothetical protein
MGRSWVERLVGARADKVIDLFLYRGVAAAQDE